MGVNNTSFKPGKSGNHKGRPRGRHAMPPHDKVLSRQVTINEGGHLRQVSAAEAFLLYLIQKGRKGESGTVVSELLRDLQKAQSNRTTRQQKITIHRILIPKGVFMFTTALRFLKIVRVVNALQSSIRFLIEPWIVQKALVRLGDNQLTTAEQAEVAAHVGSPQKVTWPKWWTVRPWTNGRVAS